MMTQDDFKQSLNRADLEIKFNEGLRSAVRDDYSAMIEVVESASNSKMEVFYGDKPNLRRWHGVKKPQEFEEYKLNITADGWELTYEWKEADLNREADPAGYLRREVQSFGYEFAKTKEDEFFKFLRNGVSVNGFDRHPLYGPSHSYVNAEGATNSAVAGQANVHWGGSQLDATTLQLEQAHYVGLRTDKNRPWGLPMTHVLVKEGSVNHKNAKELSNSQFTVESSTAKGQMTQNIFQGSFNIISTQSVHWGDSEWASFALGDGRFKPVKVLSETKNPGYTNPKVLFIGVDGNNMSESRFWRGDVAASVESYFDYNPGYWMTTRLHGSSTYSPTVEDLESQRVLLPNI